jgi:hypothetical protein
MVWQEGRERRRGRESRREGGRGRGRERRREGECPHTTPPSTTLTHITPPSTTLTHITLPSTTLTHITSLAITLTHITSLAIIITHITSLAIIITHTTSLAIIITHTLNTRYFSGSHWWPVYDQPLGAPCGAATTASGIVGSGQECYTREFAHASVLVNLSNHASSITAQQDSCTARTARTSRPAPVQP